MTHSLGSDGHRLCWLGLLAGVAAMPLLQAHRQDECLQAALIDVAPDQVRLFLSITPGAEGCPVGMNLGQPLTRPALNPV